MRPKRWYRNMTPARAAEIRRAYFAREGTQQALADLHGISQNSVSRIVSGLSWPAPAARCAIRPPGNGGAGQWRDRRSRAVD